RAFRRRVATQLVLELSDDRRRGKQAAVFVERGIPDQNFLVLERGYLVADDLDRFGRHHREYGRANLFQRRTRRCVGGRNVLLDRGGGRPLGGSRFGSQVGGSALRRPFPGDSLSCAGAFCDWAIFGWFRLPHTLMVKDAVCWPQST